MYRRAGTMYLDVSRIIIKGLNYTLLGATPPWRVHGSRHAFQSPPGRKLTRGKLRHTANTQSAFYEIAHGAFPGGRKTVKNVCFIQYCYMSSPERTIFELRGRCASLAVGDNHLQHLLRILVLHFPCLLFRLPLKLYIALTAKWRRDNLHCLRYLIALAIFITFHLPLTTISTLLFFILIPHLRVYSHKPHNGQRRGGSVY